MKGGLPPVIALKDDVSLEYDDLTQWCAGKMSSYKIPKAMKIVAQRKGGGERYKV
ncbi:hypothetical protein [Congregibacter sp.]|uniref:hypothetical protein n=1 Tax=Congregibacter sp. TaxID=2744308 RepID=UPI00385FBF7D